VDGLRPFAPVLRNPSPRPSSFLECHTDTLLCKLWLIVVLTYRFSTGIDGLKKRIYCIFQEKSLKICRIL